MPCETSQSGILVSPYYAIIQEFHFLSKTNRIEDVWNMVEDAVKILCMPVKELTASIDSTGFRNGSGFAASALVYPKVNRLKTRMKSFLVPLEVEQLG
jgi:hypothetical protein